METKTHSHPLTQTEAHSQPTTETAPIIEKGKSKHKVKGN